MTLHRLRWPLLAVLGLLVAAAIAFLATRTVGEDIGISSEPPTAGRALSPPAAQSTPGGGRTETSRSVPTTTEGTPSPHPDGDEREKGAGDDD